MAYDKTFKFSGNASHPKNAVALIYDLEGFSHFFNKPDVQNYIPAFLNHVSHALSVCIFGGVQYWLPDAEVVEKLDLILAHEKFMGDGALYVALPAEGDSDFSPQTLRMLCNRLWNLKNKFSGVVKGALDDVPVLDVPSRIRFGISRGSVYELSKTDAEDKEYLGFCINQASRLQNYCPDLGFVASARLGIPTADLDKHGYVKVVAKKVKGFPNELVLVDRLEYKNLAPEVKGDLFSELP